MLQGHEIKCNHGDYTIGSYKEITQAVYCKLNNELYGSSCAQCSIKSVSTKGRGDRDNSRMVPSARNAVMACFNVNICDHAFYKKCYSDKVINMETNTSKGSKNKRRRT